MTLLMYAIKNGHLTIANELISRKEANLNDTDRYLDLLDSLSNGNTALLFAVHKGDLNLVNHLLSRNVNVNVANK